MAKYDLKIILERHIVTYFNFYFLFINTVFLFQIKRIGRMNIIMLLLVIILIIFFCAYCSKLENFNSENNNTEIILHKGDITKLDIECIVNASNPSGLGCNIPNHCVDSAIHFAAGPELLEECKKLGGIPTGVAKITNGYKLPSKHIIHVTGPQVTKGSKDYDWVMLSKCYYAVLDLAKNHKIKEIAFCCISTGLYGYPKKESAEVAHDTIKKWINNNNNNNYKFRKIVFVSFTNEDYEIYQNILK